MIAIIIATATVTVITATVIIAIVNIATVTATITASEIIIVSVTTATANASGYREPPPKPKRPELPAGRSPGSAKNAIIIRVATRRSATIAVSPSRPRCCCCCSPQQEPPARASPPPTLPPPRVPSPPPPQPFLLAAAAQPGMPSVPLPPPRAAPAPPVARSPPPGIDPDIGDWLCKTCANWNWARRNQCNRCNAFKDTFTHGGITYSANPPVNPRPREEFGFVVPRDVPLEPGAEGRTIAIQAMAGWEKKPRASAGSYEKRTGNAGGFQEFDREAEEERRRRAKEDERQRVAEAKKARVKCVYCKRASCIC